MVCVGGCFGSGERYKKIIYYEDVRVGDRFYSSETGEEYTKNTDDLYYEDFDPKSLVYVDKNAICDDTYKYCHAEDAAKEEAQRMSLKTKRFLNHPPRHVLQHYHRISRLGK